MMHKDRRHRTFAIGFLVSHHLTQMATMRAMQASNEPSYTISVSRNVSCDTARQSCVPASLRIRSYHVVATIVAAVVVFMSAFPALAAQLQSYQPLAPVHVNAITSTATRTVIDLSGTWDVIEDNVKQGSMQVPSTLGPGTEFTIRRSIKMDQATLQSRAWHLWFLGVSDDIDLSVNAQKVLLPNPGGSAPFMIRIPDDVLRVGSNIIEITVRQRGDLVTLVSTFAPSSPATRRGVLREIFLIGTPLVWTSDVQVATKVQMRRSMATLSAAVTVKGANVERLQGVSADSQLVQQRSAIIGAEAVLTSRRTGAVVARSGVTNIEVGRARSIKQAFELNVSSPDLWSPTQPQTYELTINLTYDGRLLDQYNQIIGFSAVQLYTAEGGLRLLLNDSLFFVNAIDYYEEYPATGSTLSWRQMEHDVKLMKTLGINAIRFFSGAPHPYMLYLCDRDGIFVLTELEARGIPKNLLLEKEISAQLSNRLDLLLNHIGPHPSTLGIGLSDMLEEGTDQTNTFHRKMAELVRSRTSALVYKTVSGLGLDQTSEGGFDMIVIRANTRRSRDQLASILDAAARVVRHSATMVLIGSVVSPENENGFSDPLSMESQAVIIRDGYRLAKQRSLSGVVVSSFNDYRLEFPTMLVEHSDPYVHTSGIVDEQRQPRVAYSMYKALINEEKEPLLQARDYSDATPLVFIATGIVLALVLTLVINRSRRFREYLVRSVIRPFNFYADIRDQRILSLVQTVILGIVVAASAGLVLAAVGYYLRSEPTFEYLVHIILPSATMAEIIRYIAWHPSLAVLTVGTAIFTAFLIVAALLRVGSLFVRGRILFRDTFTIVVWAAVPLLALLPVGIALYQVLSTDAASFWIPLIIAASMLWTFLRTLRATSVVFDVPAVIVYGMGFGVVAIGLSAFVALWNLNAEGFSFFQYYLAVVSL